MRVVRIQDSLVRAFAVLIVLTIVLLGSVSLYFFQKTLVAAAERSTEQFAAQLSRIVENYITYMDDIALVVMGDEDVRSYMADPTESASRDRERIAQFLASIRSVRKDIDGIFLLPAQPGEGPPRIVVEGIVASSPGGRVNPDFDFDGRFGAIAAAIAGRGAEGGPVVSSAHVENMVEERYPWVVSLVREARGAPGTAGSSSRARGFIQVDLNYAIIQDLCKNIQLGDSGYVFILDGAGDIVYHPRQQLVYGNLKSELIPALLALREGFLTAKVDGKDILYTARPSERTGWIVVTVSYIAELFAGSRQAVYSFVFLALLCFAVAVAIASFVSLRISRPIESLRRSMQEVERGNFDMDITVECSNEVYQLARDCDIAVKKVRDLIEENRKDAEQKRVLELRALQAQINPHFLYNTLDSIVWMIELGESEAAIDVTSSLARFFRLGINRGSEIITVRTEIDYLETYLTIQKTRYKNKLDYEIAFQPEIYGFKILKLLLQPLVENAIYHGIKNKESPGLVRISGELAGGLMLFRVADDGIGMGPERLEELRRSLLDRSEAPAQGRTVGPDAAGSAEGEEAYGRSGRLGVGVRNVQDRVKLYFGGQYGLEYESVEGRGTTAILRIPPIGEGEP